MKAALVCLRGSVIAVTILVITALFDCLGPLNENRSNIDLNLNAFYLVPGGGELH